MCVQGPCRGERRLGSGLEAQAANAAVAGHADEVGEHRPADPAASGRLGGVHGFQLGVPRAKALEGPDGQQVAAGAAAEHGDGRVEQTRHVQGVDVFWGLVRGGELQVARHQRADVAGSRVVDRDRDLRHRCRDRIRGGVQVQPLPVCGQPGGELGAHPGL